MIAQLEMLPLSSCFAMLAAICAPWCVAWRLIADLLQNGHRQPLSTPPFKIASQRVAAKFAESRRPKDDLLATTKDDPLPTTTAIGPAHKDNPKQGNRTAEDPNNGAKRRAVSGQRL
jgi:hypothetical protein